MTEGLAIRPQTLHLSPQYRRLRDSILRPHLRLTESRYFWEKWKPRLGPDAAVLVMEVRDRCTRAMGHAGGLSDGVNERGGGDVEPEQTPADACTVSASELAAACGFSRVTLWRLLQREDVRRFIHVEHNYVYDRRLGKKRRTVSTYQVLMEDPLVEEDEVRLAEMEAQLASGAAGVAAVAGASRFSAPLPAPTPVPTPATPGPSVPSGMRPGMRTYQGMQRISGLSLAALATPLPAPTLQNETLVVDNSAPRFHSGTNRGGSIPKPQNVQETSPNKRLATNALTRPVPEVDLWKQYPEWAHHVEEAEQLLGDTHSRGFYIKALKRLHPGHMGVWQRALGMAREQPNIRRSRGALFTRLLRTFAAESGVDL